MVGPNRTAVRLPGLDPGAGHGARRAQWPAMLIREEPGGVVAIGQASHAWLSGQLARAWGNERFGIPEPREEVCLAAEQHDVGMSEWDLAPAAHPGAGRPLSFMEMALTDHLTLWAQAPAKLLSQSRYAALLVSLHGRALYERRDLEAMPATEADRVRAYLAHARKFQDDLIDLLRADRPALARNQRLVWTWDGMSLALCLRWSPHVAERVPTSREEVADLRLTRLGEPDGPFVVDPWPFGADEVTVRCEGRLLRGHHASASGLRTALARAPHVPLEFVLRPAARGGAA